MGLGLDNPVHLAIVLLVVLLLFGAKRLPELGRSLGGGIRGFGDSITGEDDHPLAQAEAPGNGSSAGDERGLLAGER
jgi:sec-independent protein translocase protein TatA